MSSKNRQKMGIILLTLAAIVLLASLPFQQARAMVENLTFAELVAAAEKIIVGKVVGLESHWDESKTLIVTDVLIEIRETLKGGEGSPGGDSRSDLESSTLIKVQILGGQVGDLQMVMNDVPAFELDEEVILFLQGQDWQITGWSQGKFTVSEEMVLGVGVHLDQFRAQVEEILTAQTLGIQNEFEWVEHDEAVVLSPDAAPWISSISPTSGRAVGSSGPGTCASNSTEVTILGSNFGSSQGSSRVTFKRDNSTTYNGCVTYWSNTKIMVRVPAGASTKNINVITSGGTSNGVLFTVTYSVSGWKWNTTTISYRINPNTADLTGEENGIIAAANTWNVVANRNQYFVFRGATTKSTAVKDGENIVAWANLGNGPIAYNQCWIENGVMVDCDIIFNDSLNWTIGKNLFKMDIQNIATHELGHSLMLLDLYGLADQEKTMYGFSGNGEIKRRSLEPHDTAGMQFIYPCSPPTNGITLYEHANYTGRCATFLGSDSDFGDNAFHDKASSIQFRGVYAGSLQVNLYEHSNHWGKVSNFRGNDGDFGNDTIGHDRASSLKLFALCPSITGWKAQFWPNKSMSGDPMLCKNYNNITLDWGTGSPGGIIPSDNFSARFERTMYLSAGVYRFYLGGDDGIRMWVDGVQIVNEWKDQGYTVYASDVPLKAGNHSFKIEYYESGGGAVVKLWWDYFPYYQMISKHSSKCLDVNGASLANGTGVIQWSCGSGANQSWAVMPMGGGYYKYVVQHSGKCLDVAGYSTSDGARLQQWDCTGGNNQLFKYQVIDSAYLLVNKHSNKCLDVSNWSTSDGAVIHQWACHNGNNQLWYFQKRAQALLDSLSDFLENSFLEYVLPVEPPTAPALIDYTLQEGETLQHVAALYQITVDEIASANPGIQEFTPGTSLYVPALIPRVEESMPSGYQFYFPLIQR